MVRVRLGLGLGLATNERSEWPSFSEVGGAGGVPLLKKKKKENEGEFEGSSPLNI